MARQDDGLGARVRLANAYRFAIENDVPFDAVAGAARKLAHVMRDVGTLPEQMVIAVKETLILGGAGAARTPDYGEHTARRLLFDKLVTLAIGEYFDPEAYALPVKVPEAHGHDHHVSFALLQPGANPVPVRSDPSVAISGTVPDAATRSAHYQPNIALSPVAARELAAR